MKQLSRRSFLVGSAVFASAAALSGCSAKPAGDAGEEQGNEPEAKVATQTMECDVVVAGLGASGLLAAYGAAKGGAKVIAIDSAASMDGTTNTRTSAAFAVGSSLQAVAPEPLTIEEFMNYVNSGTNYQSNGKVLRRVIEYSGRAVDVFVEGGMPFNVDFSNSRRSDAMMGCGGCLYGVTGEERAKVFQSIADNAGV